MLKWHEIQGLQVKKGYQANIGNGVDLPRLGETVLICRASCEENKRNTYFSAHIAEEDNRISLVNEIYNSMTSLSNGLKWAEFNQPEQA